MSNSCRLCLVVGLTAMLFACPVRVLAAEEATRTFPAQKCRFTLPGPDWTWIEKEAPNLLFLARNTKGFIVNLSVLKAAKPVQVNEQFAKGFDETFFKPGAVAKRAGRIVTFRGLPTYQAEGVLPDGRTTATRVFIANGFVYNLTLGSMHLV